MRYLLLNSLKVGGAERVAQVLSASGLFDGVILLEKDCDYKVDLPITFLSNHTWQTNRALKTFFIPEYAWRMKRLVKKGDIVVSFVERANFVNIICSFFVGSKAVITIHTNLAMPGRFLYKLLIKILYPRAIATVSASHGIDSGLSSLIRTHGLRQVIYNPLDLEKIRVAASAALDPKWQPIFKHQVIINAGRLSAPKGQWNLLRIFKEVLQKNPEAKLVILGDGELHNQLKNYALKLGLKIFDSQQGSQPEESSNVFLLGFQENPYQFYNRASVFVLSSLWEGLPMAIIEAMACGLPVVASDCNFGPREIISPGSPLIGPKTYPEQSRYGTLLPVPLGDLENLDEQKTDGIWIVVLSSLLQDEKTRQSFSATARQRAQDFSMGKIAGEWEKLFNKIQ